MKKTNLKKTGIAYFTASILLLAITFVNIRIAVAGDASFSSMFQSSYSGEGGESGEGGGESGEGGGESGEGGEGSGESGESGESGGESGEGGTEREKCLAKGGLYNLYLKCADAGIEKVECKENGKLTILGIPLYDYSYVSGEVYSIGWERWACETSDGNCCIENQQGLRIKK